MTSCTHRRVTACADRPGAYCRACAEFITMQDLNALYDADPDSGDFGRFVLKPIPRIALSCDDAKGERVLVVTDHPAFAKDEAAK